MNEKPAEGTSRSLSYPSGRWVNANFHLTLFAVLATGVLVVALVLFATYLGFTWTCATLSVYVGVTGWIITLPVVALAVWEAVGRESPVRPGAIGPGAPTENRRTWTRSAAMTAFAAVFVSGNLGINLAASRVDAFWESRRQQGVDIYRNHDLAKLVGECVRLAILRHATRVSDELQRSGLESIAEIAPAQWASMTDPSDGRPPDSRVLALADAKLTDFITEPRAVALHVDDWISLLADWRRIADATELTDTTLRAAAETVAQDFGITLREALKADFERGGKAWAAMQLDIAQQLLRRTPASMAIENELIAASLDNVNALLADDAKGLPALHRTILDTRQAIDDHARNVAREFDQVVGILRSIERKIDELHDKVDAFVIEATAIYNRLWAANAELSKLILDKDGEIRRLANALRIAQVAADGGDVLAEAALAEVRRTGDLKLLQETIDRIARETRKTQLARRSAEDATYLDRSREVAAIAYLRGDFDKAIYWNYEILGILPDDVDAIYRLGAVSYLRGDLDAAERHFRRMLDLSAAADGRRVQIRAYNGLGIILHNRGDLDGAEQMHRKSLAIQAEIGVVDGTDSNLGNLGAILESRGDLDGAETMYRRALAVSVLTGRLEGIAMNCTRLGSMLRARGDLDGAESMYRRSLEINQKLEHFLGIAIDLGNLAGLLQLRGNLDEAEAMHRRSLEMEERLGRLEGIATTCGSLSDILRNRGDLDGAEVLIRRALAINISLERLEGMADAYGNLGVILQTRGDLDGAETMHLKSLEIEERLGRRQGMADTYSNLGVILQTRGDVGGAEALHRKALAINEELRRRGEMATNYGNLGLVLGMRGDLDGGEAMHRRALAIEQELGLLAGQASTIGNLGIIFRSRGDLSGAEALFLRAMEINERLKNLEGVAINAANLGIVAAQQEQFGAARRLWTRSRDLYAKLEAWPMVEKLEGWLDGLPKE